MRSFPSALLLVLLAAAPSARAEAWTARSGWQTAAGGFAAWDGDRPGAPSFSGNLRAGGRLEGEGLAGAIWVDSDYLAVAGADLHASLDLGGGLGFGAGAGSPELARVTVDGLASVFIGLGFGLFADRLSFAVTTSGTRFDGYGGIGLMVPFRLGGAAFAVEGGWAFAAGGARLPNEACLALRAVSPRWSLDLRWRYFDGGDNGAAIRLAADLAPVKGRLGLEVGLAPSRGPLNPPTLTAGLSYERALARRAER